MSVLMMLLCLRPIELEKQLQQRLSLISSSHLKHDRDVQILSDATDSIKLQQQKYKTEMAKVQTLIEDMKLKLEDAKILLGSVVRLHTDGRTNI